MLFKKATGATLEVVSDSQADFNENAEYICLGYNSFSQKAGYKADSSLNADGYKIEVKNNSIFILGQNYGALYGTYGFMRNVFDYEYYYKDAIKIQRKTLLVLSDIIEDEFVPSFENRAAGYGTMWSEHDVVNPNRYGVKIYTDYFASVNGAVFHNSFACLPPNTYYNAHSAWYNEGKTQLCYTAHGNTEELTQMVNVAAQELVNAVIARPDLAYVGFIGQDNHDTCDCNTCSYYKSYYGSDSAAVILFINDLNTKFRSLLAEQGISSNVKICMMAYLGYYDVPTAHTNELKMQEGTAVMVAPIEIVYNTPFSDETKALLSAWKDLSASFNVWMYDSVYGTSSSNADCTFIPYNSLRGMKERYAFIASLGADLVFTEGKSYCYGMQSGFDNLKMFINSKLMNDVTVNVDLLIEEFFTEFYGVASDEMYSLYTEMYAHMDAMVQNGVAGTPYGAWGNKEHWDENKLRSFKSILDSALDAIESLETTDTETYNILYKRIVAERIDLDYMLITFYGNRISDVTELKAELKADIILTGFQNGSLTGEALYDSLWS